MSQIKIPSGNDFVLELICMRQVDTETKDAFDISTCSNVSLNLYDETREDYVQLNSWALAEGTTNVIRANVEGTALQPQTKYGLVITGVDENGENFKTRIRGRNFIYVVGSISDVTANDFITNPLTIQVTMNIQGELKPVNFDDLATVEVVDEKIAAAIESIDLSDYATKNELQQTNEALSSESRTRSTVDQTLQSAVEAVGSNLSSNYYTKTQVDDIVSSITGTGGDVTKEYVDNAVSNAVDEAADYTDDAISKSNLSYEKQYLTFEAITQGNITIITQGETPEFKTISYSTDNGSTWNDITTSTTEQTLATLNIGDKLLVKGLNNSYAVDNDNYTKFGGTAQVKLYGNIMSLIYGDNFIGQTIFPSESSNNFARLFEGNTKIIDAENLILPVTTLTNNCYGGMFSDCSSLTTAPELPATTLIDDCYNGMFQNCTSLTTAPKLPAIALGVGCYSYMFSGCTSLTTAPKLPAPILVSDCYSYMFQDCSSLTPAPELPATILAPHCYEGMFISCRSLTTAPELPATTLEEGCYNQIFYGCDELKYIKALFTTEPGGTYTWAWVYAVSPTGTFIKSDDAEWTPTTADGVPDGWNVYTESEYNYMHKYELQNYATQTFVNDVVDNKLSGLTNKNSTNWESTDYGFTLMDENGFDGHDNYTVDLTEGFNVDNNNTNNYIRDYKGPDNKHELFEGLYNSEHIRMQFEMGSPRLWLGNPDEVGDQSIYGLQFEDGNGFLLFDKTKDCQKAYRTAPGNPPNPNYRFGWPTATAANQYEDLITTIKLDDCNYVGQAWKDAGITEISIYGHYLNSVWLDANDPYQEVTDPYCKYYFRIEHNGSTDQHIYLRADSNFVFFRCVDWQPSEYTIDRTTTKIEGDLNVSGHLDVSGNITFNGGNDLESNINYLNTAVSHAQDLAGAAYPIIEGALPDENDVFIFQIQGDNKTTDYAYIYSQSTDPDNTLTGSSTIQFEYQYDPTPKYNMFIIKFKTDAGFSDLSITCNNSDVKIAYIGNDLSGLEAEKTYELMVEYVYDTLTYSWAEVSTQSNS